MSKYFTSACPQPQYRNRGTNEINHRNSKITECSLGCPCAGTARTDAPRCRCLSVNRQGWQCEHLDSGSFVQLCYGPCGIQPARSHRSYELCRIRKGGIMANDKNLIIVDAPSRMLFEAYGRPPFLPQPSEDIGLNSPRCTPSREDTTVADWYAEQERIHGKVAAIKAKRPKTLWQRVTSREEQEQEPAKQEPLQYRDSHGYQCSRTPTSAIDRQKQRIQTETEDGIYWMS